MITEEERNIFYKVMREYDKEDAYSIALETLGEDIADNKLTDDDYNHIADRFELDHDMTIDDWTQWEYVIREYILEERKDINI